MPESPIRIAIREEGEWVNAYIAQRATMADAILMRETMQAMESSAPAPHRSDHA